MVQLTARDREMLDGARGEAPRFAMEMLLDIGRAFGALRFIDIEWAHVAAAYDNTQVNLDFGRKLASWNARVTVPTTLTACSFDPLATADRDRASVELVAMYETMGCEPIMTCAPYHARCVPAQGTHVAWCESSAIVFANSVLGARTDKYVEFADMCAAITGRVPEFGLHLNENRRANVVVELRGLPEAWFTDSWAYHALGITLGRRAGDRVAAITGLPDATDPEHLRALGSAAASAGSVKLFHAVGSTPEAPDLDTACQGEVPTEYICIGADDIRASAAELCTGSNAPVSAVCLGAPHFSLAEFRELLALLGDRRTQLPLLVATSQATLGQLHETGLLDQLEVGGVHIVTGRCTYYRPFAASLGKHVMTNSAKWAWYAPASLGIDVTFAPLHDCIEAAVTRG